MTDINDALFTIQIVEKDSRFGDTLDVTTFEGFVRAETLLQIAALLEGDHLAADLLSIAMEQAVAKAQENLNSN